MAGSTWNDADSMLTLQVSYQVILPPELTWFHPIRITQTKTVRGWTGFGKRQVLLGEQGEEVVYVTDYGTVYHRRLNCRHLRLSIQQSDITQVGSLRMEAVEDIPHASAAGREDAKWSMLQVTETGIMSP